MMTFKKHNYSATIAFRLTSGVAFWFLFALLSPLAHGQVNFVQITDPHVFDDRWEDPKKKGDDPTRVEDNRLDNRAALASCLWEINERIKRGAKYDFGVITGDLGIEYLVSSVDEKDAEKRKTLIAEKLRVAAADFASQLAISDVHKWLIVPGNNDVVCEEPWNIGHYHTFIAEVQKALGDKKDWVVDLTPSAAPNDSRSDWFLINGYAFIGFNDSSFKNDEQRDDPCYRKDRILLNADTQKRYVVQVQDLLKRDEAKFAYVVFHIPEIDDPYLVTLKSNEGPLITRHANPALIGNSFFDSSWYVTKEVRDEWAKVVMNPKVKGLFAGHFHDHRRQSYLGFQWLRTKNYPPETLSKLHVCPPLALRIQYDQSERARGFEEIFIDDKGEVSTRIVWLTQSGWGLANDIEAKENESLRQLGLGNFYANSGQLKEAETAYVKAAESTWPPTRQRAMSAAAGVIAQQNSPSEKYFYSPVRAALATAATTGGSIVVTFIILALLILVATPFARDFGSWRGRNRIRITATANEDDLMGARFQQILITIHGRMASHYSRRHSLMIGRQPLPMLWGSQTGELADLAESVAPGAVGKVIGWLIKRTDNPQYAIVGTIQTPSARGALATPRTGAILVALSERGNTLRTWHNTEVEMDFTDEEIRLAFRSFKYLMRRQNP